MAGRVRIGIDLGGTKIEGLALDDAGAELARLRIATPQHDYAATVQAIADVVADLERRIGGIASDRDKPSVGVGIPGTIVRATGLVKNANSTWMNGQPLERDLTAKLGRPVRCANDANCLAVSEATDGAAAGAELVFAVILGTGCGGGVALNGKVHVGPNGVSGEWSTHGTCTGLNPDGYFSKVRAAFRSVEIPSMFAATQTPPASITPAALLAQFSRANPSFPPGSFALSCGNNYLTAIEVCFDKKLNPQACREVRSCRANVVKITPR